MLVEYNRNTHRDSSLYAAFASEKARRFAKRFERHRTPKHGSWLNIAESAIDGVNRSGSLGDREKQGFQVVGNRDEAVFRILDFRCSDSDKAFGKVHLGPVELVDFRGSHAGERFYGDGGADLVGGVFEEGGNLAD